MRFSLTTLTAGLIFCLCLLPEASAGQGTDKTDRHNAVEPVTASNSISAPQAESVGVRPSSADSMFDWIDPWLRLFGVDNPECLGTQCGRPVE